jgi:uncharacterized membrane protein
MTPLVAHAGHWLLGLGFAAGPLIVIAGVVGLALLERRQDRSRAAPMPPGERAPPPEGGARAGPD